MPCADLEACSLYYEIHGNGSPLLLIAGLASDSQSWLPVIPGLSQQYRVIIFDNRGSGRSMPMDDFVSIAEMADDCRLLLEYLEIESAHILGHSMGGFIAQELALRHPQRVRSLVLAATSVRNSARNNALFADFAAIRSAVPDPGLWFRMIFPWLFTSHFFHNSQNLTAAVQNAVTYPYPQSSSAFSNQIRSIAVFDRSHDLAGITQPCLVVAGNEDILFPPNTSDAVTHLLPAAQRVTIAGAAHSIHLEQPEAFCRSVMEFHGQLRQ